MTAEATLPIDPNIAERALVVGDLAALPPDQRLAYYQAVCASLGLNPLTRPFAYIELNRKLVLYALRDCAEQLRRKHHVSTVIVARERHDDLYVVTARATLPDGRCDESIGAVPLQGLRGEGLANALMKAETKAKRRVTLSICGLGMLDETEADSLPARRFEAADDGTIQPALGAGDRGSRPVSGAGPTNGAAGAAGATQSTAPTVASPEAATSEAPPARFRKDFGADPVRRAEKFKTDCERDLSMPLHEIKRALGMDVKAWMAREAAAGRPNAFEDVYEYLEGIVYDRAQQQEAAAPVSDAVSVLQSDLTSPPA
jgi:hypothetical protein